MSRNSVFFIYQKRYVTFEMIFETEKYQVKITNESDYNSDSKENIFNYKKKYLTDSDYILLTKFGITVFENGIELNSALIGAEGGASGLHKTSQIIENNRILICCSDTIFSLELPSLSLNWKTKVDQATAFQIFKIEGGFIVHGELEITRIDDKGNVIWQNGGADIFVTPDGKDNFEVNGEVIKAIDWGNRTYKWNLNGIELK